MAHGGSRRVEDPAIAATLGARREKPALHAWLIGVGAHCGPMESLARAELTLIHGFEVDTFRGLGIPGDRRGERTSDRYLHRLPQQTAA